MSIRIVISSALALSRYLRAKLRRRFKFTLESSLLLQLFVHPGIISKATYFFFDRMTDKYATACDDAACESFDGSGAEETGRLRALL
jgi:hypothetical protein